MRGTLLLLLTILLFGSCQIREEIRFKEDGSGSYEMGFDMSEMMKMGNKSDTVPAAVPVDTLINFSTFLDEKKDSIATLPVKEQKKLEALRPLQFSIKMNEEKKQMDMHLSYAFKELSDISNFADAVKKADIKELKNAMGPVTNAGSPGNSQTDSVKKDDELDEIFSMAESFNMSFNSSGFSRKVTAEAMEKMLKKKDTTLKADSPFVDMIRFKQVYHFPYRVKSVKNKHAKILSDFKGVELEANMYEINNDPEFFNIEVEFEK